MVELTPKQKEIVDRGSEILAKLHILYLAMEMRTGKTLTSLSIALKRNYSNILFCTLKKARASIEHDIELLESKMNIKVINYEQLKKEKPNYDLYILDEAHTLGAFPKPNQRMKILRDMIKNKRSDVILLSGTPSAETNGVQLFHQFGVSIYSPFQESNFYKWAQNYVDVKQKMIGGQRINDYTHGKYDDIMRVLNPLMITCTQEEAGFTAPIRELIHRVAVDSRIYKLSELVTKNRYYKFGKIDEEIIADTPAKLQNKIHQIYSGTILTENKERIILDKSKAEYIKNRFANKKIAIFYKYIAEGELLRDCFPNNTDVPEEFQEAQDKVFICQIKRGAKGVNLSTAEELVFYNIDFSAELYWQARARMQNKNRTEESRIHWIFAKDGIEEQIYEAVKNKKSFTTQIFKRKFLNARIESPSVHRKVS